MSPRDLVRVAQTKELVPLSVGVNDAAKLLGICSRKVQELALSGELPSLKIDGRRLFRVASLDRWLQERECLQAMGAAE